MLEFPLGAMATVFSLFNPKTIESDIEMLYLYRVLVVSTRHKKSFWVGNCLQSIQDSMTQDIF